MSEVERHQLGQCALRIRTRERFEFIWDLGQAIGEAEDRKAHLLNLAEAAFGDDEERLQKVYEALTRK